MMLIEMDKPRVWDPVSITSFENAPSEYDAKKDSSNKASHKWGCHITHPSGRDIVTGQLPSMNWEKANKNGTY